MENDIKLNRTRLVLKKFSSTLSQLEDERELKNYYTEYVLIVYYGEFNNQFKKILTKALEKYSTKELSVFISNAMDSIFSRVDKKDIRKAIKYFGREKEEDFKLFMEQSDSTMERQQNTIEKHQNFLTNRHNVAHQGNNVLISWEEVEKIDEVGEKILKAVYKSLGL